MGNIQQIFNSSNAMEVKLADEEYKGPLVINRPCIIEGNNAVIWGCKGPVLTINSPDVIIKNLNVELIDKNMFGLDKVAIQSYYTNTKMTNVSVIGEVKGFDNNPDWDLPYSFELGEFEANKSLSFDFEVKVFTKLRVFCEVFGVKVSPAILVPGKNKLTISISERKPGELIYGDILFRAGGVIRKVSLSGRAQELMQAKVEAADQRNGMSSYNGNGASSGPNLSSKNLLPLARGQRIPINNLNISNLYAGLDCDAADKKCVDICAFLLQKNEKVRNDYSLVFYNNPTSIDKSVSIKDNCLQINLTRIDANVEKIVVCGILDGPKSVTRKLKNANVVLADSLGNGYSYSLDLVGDNSVSVIFFEIYRYKTEWKVNVIASDSPKGFDYLCALYGVDTE